MTGAGEKAGTGSVMLAVVAPDGTRVDLGRVGVFYGRWARVWVIGPLAKRVYEFYHERVETPRFERNVQQHNAAMGERGWTP